MPVFYFAGSLLFVVAVIGGALALLAKLGGWSAVAVQFRSDKWPEGATFRRQFIRFNWVDYNGCVTIRVCPEGLGIALWPLFRFNHPSLFIPWSALHVVTMCDRWYGRYVTVLVNEPSITKLRLPLKVMEAARELSGATVAPTDLPTDRRS
jgi:hypothetical protein